MTRIVTEVRVQFSYIEMALMSQQIIVKDLNIMKENKDTEII